MQAIRCAALGTLHGAGRTRSPATWPHLTGGMTSSGSRRVMLRARREVVVLWGVDAQRVEVVSVTVKDQFVLGRGMWVTMTFIYGLLGFVALGFVVDLVTNPGLGSLLFVTLWVSALLVGGWSIFLRMPRRVEIVDDGLRFVAPTRTVEVPWRALLVVSSPRTDVNGQSLRWTWDGGALRTWGPYDHELARLLHAVRQHAPNADTGRAVTMRPKWWGLPARRNR